MRRDSRACIQDCHSWSVTVLIVWVHFNVGWLERYELQVFDASNRFITSRIFINKN